MSENRSLYCRTSLNYGTSHGVQPTTVEIRNGRQQTLSWQTNGFELLNHRSKVSDWDDEVDVASHYYSEMAGLAKALTGCSAAIVAGHISRNPQQAEQHQDYAPIQFAHSDFTDNYGALTKQRYALGQAFEAQALAQAGITATELANAQDILILQFWRNVGPAEPDLPLAFCDAQSVPRKDLVPFHVQSYANGDFAFDTFALSGNATNHRWSTFPALGNHEVVAFRTFDSRRVGSDKPYWTPHCAFLDPMVAAPAPARRSIEVRATCLF
ncbi:MAG: CmcJ/NvfI family oxidoreductase [Pseudomonadales bacterium]